MASSDDKLNKLKDQLAKEKESREAAEARAEAKAEARADEQRKQHEALLKMLSQLQSTSGHEEAKNQNTPVYKRRQLRVTTARCRPATMEEVLCPRKLRPNGISLAEEDKLGTFPP